MSDQIKVKVTRAFCIGGIRQEVGSIVEVNRYLAIELASAGKAVPAPDAPQEDAPKPRAKAKAKEQANESI